MEEKRSFELLRDLFRPKLVKIGAGLVSGLFIYDAASNQFDLPKLSRIWGMSGQLPWWGWLLIFQAVFVYALFEYIRHLPQVDVPDKILQLSSRLDRAEERLRGAEQEVAKAREDAARTHGFATAMAEAQTLQAPLVDNTTSGKGGGLTQKEREMALNAMSEVMHFIGKELTPFQNRLSGAVSNGANGVEAMDALELDRERLDEAAGRLWHEHSYPLELVDIDIMPVLQTLGALRNPIADAAEARGWPARAIQDRLMDVNQPMSELGGHIGKIRNAISAKRRELNT